MSKTNGRSGKPAKSSPRERAEALDISTLVGQPYDINAALAGIDPGTQAYLVRQAAMTQLSEFIRRAMKGSAKMPPLSGEELKAAIMAWAPSVKRRGKSPIAKISKVVATMTAEERQQLRDLLATGSEA